MPATPSGKSAKKAATSEVIAVLMGAMGHEDEDVRRNACEALVKIGEKAVTSEVIAALVGAIGDEEKDVRRRACYALGKIGEKAATSEVTAALVGVIGAGYAVESDCACVALGEIGEKAATGEVIAALVETTAGNTEFWGFPTTPVLEKCISSYEGMKKLRCEMIPKLASCIRNAHMIHGGPIAFGSSDQDLF